jgi:hypothetical protein
MMNFIIGMHGVLTAFGRRMAQCTRRIPAVILPLQNLHIACLQRISCESLQNTLDYESFKAEAQLIEWLSGSLATNVA